MLQRAVGSVLQQTFTDFELIIVDDGSTDGAAREVCALDPRIRYVRNDVPKGESGARNAGIRVARGEFLAFLDDDDEWYPQKLERQIRVFDSARPEVGVVYTGVETREVSGEVRIERAVASGDVYDKLFQPGAQFPVNNISMLVRRACFDDVGLFDEDAPYGVAWDIHVRLAKRWRFLPVEEPLVIIHRPTEGISTDASRVIAGHRYMAVKHAAELARRREWSNRSHFQLGFLELKQGNVAQARKDLLTAIAAWPLRWKPWACFAVTLLPRPARERVVSRLGGPGPSRGR